MKAIVPYKTKSTQGNPYLSTGDSEETHIATNHEDTTSGAVHCFRDEYGNWQTYTFGSDTAASSTVRALCDREVKIVKPYTGGGPCIVVQGDCRVDK